MTELTDEVGDCHAKIDRFLRNSLHDDDYAEYSECLEVIVAALALQSERHAEELLAYEVTVGGLRAQREQSQPGRKPMTDDQAQELCWKDGIQDCLQDPYDKLNNGSDLSSIQPDMVRLIRAVEAFHGIKEQS